jgi:hypothetical protein
VEVRKKFAAAMTGALVAIPVAGLAAGYAGAEDAPTAFQAVAAADAFRITVAAPGLSVVNTLFDLAAPTAQASVNGVGASSGYAAFPDPGELVLTGPGLLAGASGGALSFPPYPLAVQSSAGSAPDAKAGEGPFLVEAHSTPQQSTALSQSGSSDPSASAGLLQSTARAALDESTTVAEANSTAKGFAVGPLTVASSVAKATATIVPGQDPQLATDFTVHGIDVAGTAVGLTPAGLVIAGTETALPANDPARTALAEAGLDVQYLEASAADGAARSAGMRITLRQVFADGIPNVIPPGQVVEYRITLGQAVARAGASGVAVGDVLGDLPDLSLPPDESLDDSNPALVVGETASSGSAGGTAAAPRLDLAARPAAEAALPVDRLDFYWVLAVGALAAAVALHFNRTARRRRHWLALLEGPPSPAEGGSS